ncbi:RsmE family RNA methyltransferase [Candidatus Odyssella thessalonicensis]|uniref:RsmE family RNA methyltransferase n=1 Tax=Candidatus Odyssella thessalonicensis TaxID=84647 RepID=UPI000225C07A|nr:RsmE family RNA methyltransferase [Candidatus Odyssella thessalonicensis]
MTRLYYPEPLSKDARIVLQEDHVHYLRNVLRQQVGDQVNIFNAHDGEWHGHISTLTKSHAEISLQQQVRQPEGESPIMLLFCPLKHDPTHYLIEKCTEVGVTVFQPIIMERGNIHKINQNKLQRIAIEAAQQCERLSVPEVRELRPLRDVLKDWPEQIKLSVCAERAFTDKQRLPFAEDLANNVPAEREGQSRAVTLASLIGPEGGIHPQEIELLSNYPFVQFVSLGKNILRAETAAVVAATKMVLG